MTMTTERSTAPGPQTSAAAGPAHKKIRPPRDQDPRNPKFRLRALLEAGHQEGEYLGAAVSFIREWTTHGFPLTRVASLGARERLTAMRVVSNLSGW